MIKWSELKPYQNDKYRSFEELCYQIAKGLYREMGRFTSIDDSGGGDGVEFYLTLPNGDQWGWQAKFYYPNKRLNSSRKRSITNSLQKACEVHPRLKKWFLCTPTNFTLNEQTWFDNTLRQSTPEDVDVALEHWGDSDFNNWLSEPRFRGKYLYFFNKLELDMDWFKTQFDKQKAWIGNKFDSSLHTETDADAEIHALLGDETRVKQITGSIEKLEEELANLNDAVDNLNEPIQKDIVWDAAKKDKVANAAKPLQDTVIKTIDQFKQAKEFLKENMLYEAQTINWDCVFKKLEDALSIYRIAIDESDISEIEYTGESKYKARILDDTRWLVHRPESIIANLLDDSLNFEMYKCKLINHSELKIFGNAGVGKTHIVCNICDDRLNNGLPALFVRGSLFITDEAIEAQLCQILDISSSYRFNDFLKALSAAAEAYNTRIPLIIDGLNEATHNGKLSRVWENYLKGLVYEIEQTKNVVLITTCRTSYKKPIWNDEYPPYSVDVEGFDTDEVRDEAIQKYFKKYNINDDLTLAPLTQFKNPIYLSIYCETKKRNGKTEEPDYIGEQALFEIFDEYLIVCNKAICDNLNRHESASIVQTELNKIAEYLWTNCCRHIPFEKLGNIVDSKRLDELDWDSSKSQAILNEDLLVYRDWGQFGESVYFTYDLLGGYLIAKYLLEQAADDVQRFLNSEEIIAALFSENYQTLHPMYEDIGRSLAALLPSNGQFLHKLLNNQQAFGLSICALFEISPKDINEECINLITDLFGVSENRESFFKLAETTVGHPSHPFYASFWSDQLLALSMPERDLSWSEYIRLYSESFEKRLNRFEETCQSDQELSDIGKERLHLLAEHIMWIFTSTVRPLRDQATRALHWYGRRFPQEFFDLVIKSFTINDPYVPERMLAATYGIAMARQNDFEDTSFVKEILPIYGKQLYAAMFKPNAPHATTHILARDYAKRTIDIALMYHPELLTANELERITPPFTDGGIREWGECKDEDAGPYQSGAAPLQMDFGNYTLGCLVKGGGNYNFEHPGYKRVRANIFWRIYDLGFSLDSFEDIDGSLGAENYRKYGRSANGGKTDRYGKKYSWIAFYELAGFRQDNDLLPDYHENVRILDIDIDPSFPDEQYRYNLVKEDFLGDRNVSHEEWIFKSNHPDLTNYLKIDRLCDEEGPWVLLWGSLSQEDKKDNRDIFALIQGLIVKPEETETIVKTFMNQDEMDRTNMPFCPEDYYTYAGEVPWCDTYPENSYEEIQIEIGKALALEQHVELLRDGKPIPWDEKCGLWDSIKNLLEKGDKERLNELLSERNLGILIEKVKIKEPEYQTFRGLVPVRENNWEDHRSAANSNRSVAIPSRQIAETLSLCGQPQSFDLFQKENGKRASMTFRYGEGWGEMQHFTYIRQDLLERYLSEIGAELIWIIWGERRQVSQNPGAPYKYFHEVKTYSDI